MSSEMNINEIISELDRISALYNRYQALNADMDNVVDEKEEEDGAFGREIVETLNEFKREQDQNFGAKKPRVAPACLEIAPERPKKPNTTKPVKDIFIGAVSGLVTLFSVIFWGALAIINPDNSALGLILLSVFLLFGSVVFWFSKGAGNVTVFVNWCNAQKEWQKKHAEWEKKFNQSATKEENDRFLGEFREYDRCFLKLVDICSEKYAEEFKRYEDGLEKIKEKYVAKLDRIHNEISEVCDQLEGVTLIHNDLFNNAWRISAMLKTGRADSLKEAINLALDEERKDMEEEARRAEARQQQAILEQQARDNRIHNETMARAAEEEARAMRAHNAAMERAAQAQAQAAQAQAREAARQTEMAQRQARDAQKAASARCARCANFSKCSLRARQNAVNCSGYRPR